MMVQRPGSVDGSFLLVIHGWKVIPIALIASSAALLGATPISLATEFPTGSASNARTCKRRAPPPGADQLVMLGPGAE